MFWTLPTFSLEAHMSTSTAPTQELKSNAIAPGDFVWYELVTSDLDAAEKFYSSVIGWKMKDAGVQGMRYTLVSAGETQIAGMMTQPGAPPGWLGYIAVADVDRDAARIKQAGGAIYREPQDIPNIGRFAVVADPQGAVFVIFKGASTPPERPDPTTPGFVAWNELTAADMPSAFAFYAEQFGWRKSQAFDMGPMGVYQTFATNDVQPMAGGMMTGSADALRSSVPGLSGPHWRFSFTVDNIRTAVDKVVAGGGKVIRTPEQVPGGRWAAGAQDPQGGFFGLLSANG
jgi:predicted enzyme related to lactoylglutathione lyase